MIQTTYYKTLARPTIPTLSEILTALPEGHVMRVASPISVAGTHQPVGYKKISLSHNGNHYSVVVKRVNRESNRYIIELNVSPHYKAHDGTLADTFALFAKALERTDE